MLPVYTLPYTNVTTKQRDRCLKNFAYLPDLNTDVLLNGCRFSAEVGKAPSEPREPPMGSYLGVRGTWGSIAFSL